MTEEVSILTYVDAGVLIAAFGAGGHSAAAARSVLGDPRRIFISSDILLLEVLPQPLRHRRDQEVRVIQRFLKEVEDNIGFTPELFDIAFDLACQFGLSSADALHLAACIKAGCQEFVTTEKKTRAFGSVQLPGLQLTFLTGRKPTP